MSWRSMLEFNHDRVPSDEGPELTVFATALVFFAPLAGGFFRMDRR